MKGFSFFLSALAFVFLALPDTGAVHAAEPYQVGDIPEAFTVTEAKGDAYSYTPGKLDVLIVSFAMSPGKAVNGYFSGKPADYLEQHRAAFLANIYGMPDIGRFFALPKMRKYPHRILLGDDEKLLVRYPSQEDRVTVFSFDARGAITAIRFLDPEKDLDGLFPAR